MPPVDGAERTGDASRTQNATSRSGVGRVVAGAISGEAVDRKSLLDALGGVRGIVESVLPGIVFLVWYSLTKDPKQSALAPIAVAVIFLLVRLVRKEALMPAMSGLLAVGVCGAAALFTGRGETYFLPGFFVNGAWILALLASLLVKWPLLGVILGLIRGDIKAWRADRLLFRAAVATTILWLVMFVARLGVQLPMYFTGNVEALGTARLVMGIPLYALVVVVTWRVLAAAMRRSGETHGSHTQRYDEPTL